MGRPVKTIDEKELIHLAQIGCTRAEIALHLGISDKTMQRRFDHLYRRGEALRNMSLRQQMFKKAKDGNAPMQIWLSKQWLGFKDRVEASSADGEMDKLAAAIDAGRKLMESK